MPLLKRAELRQTYKWKTTAGDNPHLIHDDAKHLSRNERYEMLSYLNHLGWSADRSALVYDHGLDVSKEDRLCVEWMLKVHFRSTSPGRGKVTEWVNLNWAELRPQFSL
ncbi:hypothetical protein [Pseudomonas graminis]|uniref:Uncharacterized protein n=1 Tax=Pseudomonas graminis TaxID=158627 RepID=A0A1C2EEZ6_9PSED|nr:hypothetical protein [Pseudomonas graminis]OCX25486.1 hypothetical protein BBI10_02000 [Pseudomonas graminis]